MIHNRLASLIPSIIQDYGNDLSLILIGQLVKNFDDRSGVDVRIGGYCHQLKSYGFSAPRIL